MPRADGRPRAWSRFAWFVALYVLSFGAFTVIVYGFRALVPR
jgi:hypothetical protein